ncbi:hypothetical protein SAMN05216186_1072 [Pseudomonas indica]|uniref:Uncharacterized protein n=1 Tax=Pseudomonas indica TaxID=137658 RepID=A0A1G9BRA1_9PSED|nr:hypothetical protein SAMN05216186_1072 [Pseudomonas indica]
MGHAVAIRHPALFAPVHYRKEFSIGKTSTGFAVRNSEHSGVGLAKGKRRGRSERGRRKTVADKYRARASNHHIPMRATTAHGSGRHAVNENSGGQSGNQRATAATHITLTRRWKPIEEDIGRAYSYRIGTMPRNRAACGIRSTSSGLCHTSSFRKLRGGRTLPKHRQRSPHACRQNWARLSLIVPTLRVGMPPGTLRVTRANKFAPTRPQLARSGLDRSHAPRGNASRDVPRHAGRMNSPLVCRRPALTVGSLRLITGRKARKTYSPLGYEPAP